MSREIASHNRCRGSLSMLTIETYMFLFIKKKLICFFLPMLIESFGAVHGRSVIDTNETKKAAAVAETARYLGKICCEFLLKD